MWSPESAFLSPPHFFSPLHFFSELSAFFPPQPFSPEHDFSPAALWLIDEPLSALDPARAQQAIRTLVDRTREAGITLVATLHQVDVALAHFPRVVGMREGRVMFDLPAAAVTRERLQALYDQYEHELRGEVAVPLGQEAPAPVAPVVMHCR